LRAIGYGAGTRVLSDRPNVLSVALGDPLVDTVEALTVLETNLDDVTGELLSYVITGALAAGALDAWATPAVMKKGRPAHVLHVLARSRDADRLQELIFAETGTLGVRRVPITRTAVPRGFETVEVDGVPIRIKHGPYGAKPEHDDVADAAAKLGLPLRVVAERAMRHSSEGPI
ncbi:MAG: DUF111 family protein, partial [Catenulispora sp.]|nr:DUF111 family protein [Catenulispora sp.]